MNLFFLRYINSKFHKCNFIENQSLTNFRLMKIIFSFALLSLLFFQTMAQNEKQVKFKISTKFGDMIGVLYNETPQHRDNFKKLIQESFFDSLLFHRVIKDFMVQGGDPNSKGAASGVSLGNGGPGYTIPMELDSNLIHKKGALAAARTGDQGNPLRASSGSQFYIVQGKTYDASQMQQMEMHIQQDQKSAGYWLSQYQEEFFNLPENLWLKKEDLQKLQTEQPEKMKEINASYSDFVMKKPSFSYTDEQKELYETIGGTPFLDQQYTVFGEIIEGLDVIDKIAAVKCGASDRPEEDVIMKIELIEE